MASKKAKVDPYIKFCIAFTGFQIITTYTIAMSVADVWIELFSVDMYTTFNYVGSIPMLALALFIPYVLKFFSVSTIFYSNVIIQIVSDAFFISVPTIVKYNKNVGLAVTFIFLLIASSCFAVTQTAIYSFAAEFSNQTVQFYVTGLAFPNMIFGLYFLPFPYYVKNLQFRMLCYCALPLVVHIASAFIFHATTKRIPKKEEMNEIEVEYTEEKLSFRESFLSVVRKKWVFLLLNFMIYFLGLLVYPSFMLQAKSSNPSLRDFWPKILIFLFGISEVTARIINTMKIKFIANAITEKNLWIFCFVPYTSSVLLFLSFLALRNVFYWPPLLIDIINGVFYSLLSFSVGIVNNNIAVFVHSRLKTRREVQAAGSLFNLANIVAIVLGLLVSHFISKSVK
ncbi:hypothetical protein MHBO_003059 [Bonamia ostreae]|uniref:Uncharacterized protein n=1 Tax=Bonamia ostreae TaxID=126728 RepID=A0ABV2AQ45_9EUKA